MALRLRTACPTPHPCPRKACAATVRRPGPGRWVQPDGKVPTVTAGVTKFSSDTLVELSVQAELEEVKAGVKEVKAEMAEVKQIAVNTARVNVLNAASEVAAALNYGCLCSLSKAKHQPKPPRNVLYKSQSRMFGKLYTTLGEASEQLLAGVAGGDVESFCASVDDVIGARCSAIRPFDLGVLDRLVAQAQRLATPMLRAATPELGTGYRLLDKYQDVIRPLVEEAL